jgi:hypothetical protein
LSDYRSSGLPGVPRFFFLIILDALSEASPVPGRPRSVLERALTEELTGHLGYEKHDPAGRGGCPEFR